MFKSIMSVFLVISSFFSMFITEISRLPENKYNSDSNNMLFLGVVGQRKGVYDLLQAVKLIDSKLHEDVKLYIYGPDFEKKIEAAIAEQDLLARVKYCGWLNATEKEKVFSDTAVNILPSYNEGLPMTILECMAHGIPNISTNVAAIPEAVSNENGIITEPGDVNHLAQAIEMMMSNREERSTKSRNAFEDAKLRFSVDTHLANMIDIYREVLGYNA